MQRTNARRVANNEDILRYFKIEDKSLLDSEKRINSGKHPSTLDGDEKDTQSLL